METFRAMSDLLEEIENYCRRRKDRLFRHLVTPLITLEGYKIYELLRDAPLQKIFLAIAAKSGGLEKAALSPEEVKKFYATHNAFIRMAERPALFLVEFEKEFCVAMTDDSTPGNLISLARYQPGDYLTKKAGYYIIVREKKA
jgi:hypothetical protein